MTIHLKDGPISRKQGGRSGANPLAYMGVMPESPANFVTFDKDPTTKDFRNWVVGDEWLNRTTRDCFKLVSVAGGVATWIKMLDGGGGGNVLGAIRDDAGVYSYPDANDSVKIAGGLNTNTVSSANTITVNLNNPYGVTTGVADAIPVVVDSNGQLGTAPIIRFSARSEDPVVANTTGDGTVYEPILVSLVGSTVPAASWDNVAGKWTVPVTGSYQINLNISLTNLDAGHTSLLVNVLRNGASNWDLIQLNPTALKSPTNNLVMGGCTIMNLIAGDLINFGVRVAGGTKTVGYGGSYLSTFNGFLL